MLQKQLGLAIFGVAVVLGSSVDCFAGHRHKMRRNAAASACVEYSDPCVSTGYYGATVTPAVQSGCGCGGSSISYNGYQQSAPYGVPMQNGYGVPSQNGYGTYSAPTRQLGSSSNVHAGVNGQSTSANANLNTGSVNGTGSVNAGGGVNVPSPSNINAGAQTSGNIAVPTPPVPKP